MKATGIVRRIDNINAYYALMALIPVLFFVPIMSAFRGYFQGRQNMVPTALSQARINIVGAALSTVVAYGITASLNLRALNKEIRRKINYGKLIYDPLLSSIIMGVLTTLSHRSLSLILSSGLATILSMGLGGLSYVILLIIRGTIRIEDVVSLPKRRKIRGKIRSGMGE